MKKNIRRNAVLIMLIAFTTLILSGCFLKKLNKKEIEVLTDYPETETLTFYFIGSEPKDAKKILSQVEARLKTSLNVKLDFNWISSRDYVNQIKSMLDSGKQIDAFQITGSSQSDPLNSLVKDGRIMDITSLLKQRAPKLYASYGEKGLSNVTYDGKTMGIPDNFPRSARICAVIREETASKYNIQNIRNYEDLEKLLQALSEEKDGIVPLGFNKDVFSIFGEASGFIHLGNRLVYRQSDKEMKLIPWEQTNEFKKAVQTIQNWSDKKYFNASTLRTVSAMNPVDAITKDMVSTVLTDWDTAQAYTHTHPGLSIKLKIYPLYAENISVKPTDYAAIVLNKDTKKADRIIKFVQWVQTSQENYDLFMYGIQGENYKLEGDRVTFTDDKSRYFGWDGSQVFLNVDLTHLSPSDSAGFRDEYKKITEDNSKYAPSTGFKPDYSQVQDMINKRNQSYNNFNNMVYGFGMGTGTYIDDYINENKNLGVEDLVKEIQKQLDLWKTKNK